MNKLIIGAGAAALLALSPLTVLAAEATGMISSIDVAAGTVTLDSGDVYKLPTTVAIADFKVGQKVKITFDAQPGNLMVSAISLAPVAGAPAAGGATTPPAAAAGVGGDAGNAPSQPGAAPAAGAPSGY